MNNDNQIPIRAIQSSNINLGSKVSENINFPFQQYDLEEEPIEKKQALSFLIKNYVNQRRRYK